MEIRRAIELAIFFAAAALIQGPTQAQSPASHDQMPHIEAKEALAEGQVVKIDEKAFRLTLKHGEIKSLDMGPMTMSFRVSEAALLKGLQVGDHIHFRAEKEGDDFVITHLEKP